MIYRSNLIAPDLQPHFAATTICKPRDWSMGHDVMSDKDYEPDCCFMTHDEAAILFNVARGMRPGGTWADIGARFGWTTAHIAAAGAWVVSVDPVLKTQGGLERYQKNTDAFWNSIIELNHKTASEWREKVARRKFTDYSGYVIDADHDAPQPLNDARGALALLKLTGVIVFHDFWGRPIREGVEYLIEQGLKCRVYNTPAGMAVCWRGEFTPPDHVADPAIDWAQVRVSRAPEFDFNRTI